MKLSMKTKDLLFNALVSVRSQYFYAFFLKILRLGKKRNVCGKCDLLRFSKGIITEEIIRQYKKAMVIKRGLYEYEYFNVCFLNNVLALCLRAVCEGFIPRIEILNSKGENIWEMFFLQPFEDMDVTGMPRMIVDIPDYLETFPSFDDVYSSESIRQWGEVFHCFAKFNEKVQAYIEEEIKNTLDGKKVLGVLCRGTDYIETKPKGHPIQPDIESMISTVKNFFIHADYQYIYLATEDSRYDKAFQTAFDGKLLRNKRIYYDDIFLNQGMSLIKDVHFNREDDDYLKGLEYVSSLQIISKCEGLIAGNCGGTQAAVFWNNGQYQDLFIFNLGLYE